MSDNLHGSIKFFNPKKGFGFITANDVDYFVHVNVIKNNGFTDADMTADQPVEFSIERTERGTRVAHIHSVGKKHGTVTKKVLRQNKEAKSNAGKQKLELGETAVGTIKFYNEEKRYGFLTMEEYADVFFHISAVPEKYQSQLCPGTSFEFEMTRSKMDDRLMANITKMSKAQPVSVTA